jgi:ATP phosphoribosyltransferase
VHDSLNFGHCRLSVAVPTQCLTSPRLVTCDKPAGVRIARSVL